MATVCEFSGMILATELDSVIVEGPEQVACARCGATLEFWTPAQPGNGLRWVHPGQMDAPATDGPTDDDGIDMDDLIAEAEAGGW